MVAGKDVYYVDDKKTPFPPHRWGEATPLQGGWFWFVGDIKGQWKHKFSEPTMTLVALNAQAFHKSLVWHEHEYGLLQKSLITDCGGRWWGPIKPPGKWER